MSSYQIQINGTTYTPTSHDIRMTQEERSLKSLNQPHFVTISQIASGDNWTQENLKPLILRLRRNKSSQSEIEKFKTSRIDQPIPGKHIFTGKVRYDARNNKWVPVIVPWYHTLGFGFFLFMLPFCLSIVLGIADPGLDHWISRWLRYFLMLWIALFVVVLVAGFIRLSISAISQFFR